MTTTEADIELAIVHVNRAVEKARFFSHSEPLIERLSLLRRGLVDAKEWTLEETKH